MGLNSTVSNRLNDVRRTLRTKKTRGRNPRDLEPNEIEKLEAEKIELEAEMEKQKQVRFKARAKFSRKLNSHTTAEVNRCVAELKETVIARTKPSENFFESVGGAGSSTDLRAQMRVLGQRANDQDKADRAMAREVNKKELALQKLKEKADKLEEKEHAQKKKEEANKEATNNKKKGEASAGTQKKRQRKGPVGQDIVVQDQQVPSCGMGENNSSEDSVESPQSAISLAEQAGEKEPQPVAIEDSDIVVDQEVPAEEDSSDEDSEEDSQMDGLDEEEEKRAQKKAAAEVEALRTRITQAQEREKVAKANFDKATTPRQRKRAGAELEQTRLSIKQAECDLKCAGGSHVAALEMRRSKHQEQADDWQSRRNLADSA